MAEIDRSRLPIRRAPFQGVANRTLEGSQPDWNLIGHPTPPDGAPNVLLVLIDDAGFGNPTTFGGPISTPNYTRLAEQGASLQPVPRHGAVLADPGGAADRPQQPRGRLRLGGRVRGWFPRLLRHAAAGLRAAASHPARQRLQHRRLRQVAPDARRAAGPGRARSTAGRTAGASTTSTASSAATPASGTRAWRRTRRSSARRRSSTTRRPLLPSGRHGRQDHRVAPRRARPGRQEAVLRLLLDGLQPRAAPRRRRRGRTSTRASSTRAGTSSAKRPSRARRRSASFPPTPS